MKERSVTRARVIGSFIFLFHCSSQFATFIDLIDCFYLTDIFFYAQNDRENVGQFYDIA